MTDTSDGVLWAMGSNVYGQLGDGTYIDAVHGPVPVMITGEMMGKTIELVYAGQWINFVLTTDKQLFGWGKNDLDDLGAWRPEESLNFPVPVYPYGSLMGKTIAQFSFRTAFPLILTTDTQSFSWVSRSATTNCRSNRRARLINN